MSRLFSIIALLAALFFISPPSRIQAQQNSSGSVSGSVRDAAGAVVANADVRLLSSQQLILSATKTDAEGLFKFENVKPGSYVVMAERRDFSPQREAVQINGGAAARVNLILEVNQLNEQVTVTAETGSAGNRHNIPQQINVVSENAVRQRTTAVLSQVANEEVGVTQQRTSPTIGAVSVRGLTEVGVYVDGVRYTNSTQRGGINTFFNLNEPTALRSFEVQRSPNTAQYGSDGLGGNVQLVSRQPDYGFAKPEWHGEFNTFFTSADLSFGSNALVTYGTRRFGILGNIVGRRVNTLRPGGGIDSHSAITRFLGLPSNITGSDRLPDTAFTQYGGTLHLNFAPTDDQQFSFRYQRSQQDGGKRYDQLLGGDGNLIADLRNLMLDFGYLRYYKQGAGFFDNFSTTVSYNSQREERVNQGGQGNPLAAITHDKERTTTWGASFYLDKQFKRNNFLFGGDVYRDNVVAPSYTFEPATRAVTITRPRVPNGATYLLAGLYIQDVYEIFPNRLRLSGALRYNVANYRSRAANSPLVNNQPLFPDDSLRSADFSGRIGATFTITKGLNVAFNYSRGFRAPNITALGSLGLVGVGYQVSNADIAGLGATIGSTADANALDTGVPVTTLRSEISDNYELSLRYINKRLEANVTGFVLDLKDAIARQTLILPSGAVGRSLGSQIITNQLPSGAVFVPVSTAPVLVQANLDLARVKGIEGELDYRLTDSWIVGGNFTVLRAENTINGEPPNLGGAGFPPPYGFLRLRYQPPNKKYWIEGYSTVVARQNRFSSLDLSDRRTGAARSRSQIQNFLRRGACVRGLTVNTSGTGCGTTTGNPNYILQATGETITQVLNRVLPLGATINGVRVVNNDTAVPLYTAYPGYALFNLRGGFRFNENQAITADFENIFDKSHRSPGWGIDGPGRSVTVRYQYRF
ncbi:MAG TPA: TonB-dependent receptor [Pyrinomonadaceae bacterium]|jgi:outer membrane receptor protein involved in Fe transport